MTEADVFDDDHDALRIHRAVQRALGDLEGIETRVKKSQIGFLPVTSLCGGVEARPISEGSSPRRWC
ncbi:MAG: hypothetical protein ACWA6X_13875 [Bauldia sp.]